MKLIFKKRHKIPEHFRIFEDPVTAEIFSVARLEMHGESLARAQTVIDNPRLGRDIAPRIAENRRILEESYRILLHEAEEHRAITPAGEWLIDNFHIVRAQLKDIHDHLSPEYYRELPKLADGPLAGYPRVYGIAWAFVAHTDSRFAPDLLESFLKSYQRVQPLTIGELWAVPITLRVVMIENLRRLAARIVGAQLARNDANRLADEVLGLNTIIDATTTRPTRPLSKVIESIERKPFVMPFAVQLLLRLRFQDPRVDPVLEFLEKKFAKENLIADAVVSDEHALQTRTNASVRNVITSCRLMSAFNWQNFFESVSLVEATFRSHRLYPQMDFSTRDRYRHGLEELGRHSAKTEIDVARLIVDKALTAQARVAKNQPIDDPRCIDLGYYLISTGRLQIEKEIGFKPPFRLRLLRWYINHATPVYLGLIAFVTAGLLALTSGLELTALMLLAIFPASEIAISLINRLTVAIIGPQYLPRLSLESGVPAEYRTFVVVPTLLISPSKVEELLEQLEIHYLSNQGGDLYFALLTDWLDAEEETTSRDDVLLETAALKLNELNQKYGPTSEGYSRFHVFHRRRLYNEREGKWMGWERKRGKLHEFNKLLLGQGDTSFIPLPGQDEVEIPERVRYVVTLDSDTRLTHSAINQLVGTLAHPLNRARFNEKEKRVVGGYGILQPRITPALPSAKDSTIFQTLSAGPSGIDPYATAVSDVYQDLFGEGSFTGKGIYDPRIFEAALEGRIPENTMLSHDLFEGNYVRCGYLSDVEFFEDFPSHSEVSASRSHRWIRGDWQLLPWIFGARGGSLPLINRWKMFDNLRRSLVTPAIFLLLIAALFTHDETFPLAWVILSCLSLMTGSLLAFAIDLVPRRRNTSQVAHLRATFQELGTGLGRFLLFFSLIPHHAWLHIDAVARSIFRVFITRRHLLEWMTAAQATAAASIKLKSFVRGMRVSLVSVFLVVTLCLVLSPIHALAALPMFLLWLASPFAAWKVSSPPVKKLIAPLMPDEVLFLELTARRIWRFFATFVTAEDHYLPPDNFQETPDPVVAHRSSPTNFGLYLLSTLAARDFGWIGTIEAVERLENTLKSLLALPRYEGHFYNWYETTEPRVLEPKYISSVDNGNLAGHLLATAQGLTEILNSVVKHTGFNRGILDTLTLLEQAIKAQPVDDPALTRAFSKLADLTLVPDHVLENRQAHWTELREAANAVIDAASAVNDTEVQAWARALRNDIESSARDFLLLASWSDMGLAADSLAMGLSNEPGWDQIARRMRTSVCLKDIPDHCASLIRELKSWRKAETPAIFDAAIEALDASILNAKQQIQKINDARKICYRLFNEMDFGLLYDPERQLFSIGYRVADQKLDPSYYDLLASEARLTSYIAIAKGDVPAEHWFRLGRGLTVVNQGVALISWSGSMFEYLMPLLVMRTPEGSLMEQTCDLIVQRQIDYGSEKRVPWGISESAYNKRDLHLTYQYTNFGVPDLGLKRGLGTELVVAPYATLLALMIDPSSSAKNLARLKDIGALGPYGFYEAVDYTPSRLREDESFSVVKAYMAHHQGMALVAIANLFKDGVMQRRFHNEAMVQASELLLQERSPRNVSIVKPSEESYQIDIVKEETDLASRKYRTVDRPVPTTLLLSNGNYSVMLTSAGAGWSRLGEIALTRWREDVTRDSWGSFIYLKDLSSAKVWSAGHQPTCVHADRYEVTFSEDRARFSREDDLIASDLEVFVSPEENAEIRRLTLTNNSDSIREIEITSYCEAVVARQGSDEAHPAFSNLFVQTDYIPWMNALVATRRARSSTESPMWVAQVLSLDTHAFGEVEYETERARFIGRGRSARNPRALDNGVSLSNTVGSVLDPALAFRTRVRLNPGAIAHVTLSTIIEKSREDVIRVADKFRDESTFERATSLAWTQAQVKLHFLGIEADEAHLFQRLATRLVFLDPSLRPASELIRQNRKNVTGLWAHGISGDFPIMLVRIDDIEDRGIVRQLLKAHEYLGAKGLRADLVILNEKSTSYAQELQKSLEGMVHSSTMASHVPTLTARGKVFILRSDMISSEDRTLLLASSRVVISSRQGSLAEQVKRSLFAPPKVAGPVLLEPARTKIGPPLEIPELQFSNGLGGFTTDGREYVTVLKDGDRTPAPWLNVVSNPSFGFQVSESGSGYTWSQNSRENQLTPWLNDPVCDPSGEAFYIRDEETGALWSPTASPIRKSDSTYVAHHGHGYSRFRHSWTGIESDLTQFVTWTKPVKISRLTLVNHSGIVRTLSAASYVEWVLGFSRATTAISTITEVDSVTGAVFASNVRSDEYGTKIAFASFVGTAQSLTCDRAEFIGRNGSLENPLGLMSGEKLSGRAGAGLDPCAAFTSRVTLQPGQKIELVFVLGQAEGREHARQIIEDVRAMNVDATLNEVTSNWQSLLTKVQVRTPDPSMDLMLNHWLLYQTTVCRFWARAALYQAGGAFGFRDQLQDCMALMITAPKMAREHILRAAARQFGEGDVQHWWHPPFGRGVRTHFSDDLVWLPYVVSHYLKVTGDRSILAEEVPFIEGPLLLPEQEDSYYTPATSVTAASLFEHCARALDKSLATGAHGLPLMGAGDWNDGMNRVGHDGRGESVWLAWFLYTNLSQFAPIAERGGDPERARVWSEHAEKLRSAVEREAWDGRWYRRAYFGDGTPLGSASNEECRIDSLTQTWAVLSRGADPERAALAMEAVEEFLVRAKNQMILLFTPAFDKTPLDPGYIKGYIPGVRENGGQYTHAAVWCVMAYAELDNGRRAHELFSLLNPINHARTPEEREIYKVEPYVLAADVYSEPPHCGRGGWTWYTGSSGWMYRSGLESILGFNVNDGWLVIDPCVNPDWPSYSIRYVHGSSVYEIEVKNPDHVSAGVVSTVFDGAAQTGSPGRIKLVDDGRTHSVVVTLGRGI